MDLFTCSAAETIRLGEKLGGLLKEGDLVALVGELGTGKTVLTRGLAKGLGAKKEDVASPSFVLLREYNGRLPVYHFDLYRLNGPEDIARIGYEEYFYGAGVTIIEWADRVEELLPAEHLRIELYHKNRNERLIKLIPLGKRYKKNVTGLHIYKRGEGAQS